VASQHNKVFAWRCVDGAQPPSCLSLPSPQQCTADLVCVLTTRRRTGLLAVGAQGHVRYWPQLGRLDSATVEASVPLSGGVHATTLSALGEGALVLGASDGSIYLIEPSQAAGPLMVGSGTGSLLIRPIVQPVGMLGRLWSRIHSFHQPSPVRRLLRVSSPAHTSSRLVFRQGVYVCMSECVCVCVCLCV
jgi:hypothetical protein